MVNRRRRTVIYGYIGSKVGADQLFEFRKISEFTDSLVLDRNFPVQDKRNYPDWKKVRITVDVLDDEAVV